MQQFRQVSRTRTIYSTETHTSDFILNTFWNGKPVQFFSRRSVEWWWRDAKRTSLAAKFWIFCRGLMTELSKIIQNCVLPKYIDERNATTIHPSACTQQNRQSVLATHDQIMSNHNVSRPCCQHYSSSSSWFKQSLFTFKKIWTIKIIVWGLN